MRAISVEKCDRARGTSIEADGAMLTRIWPAIVLAWLLWAPCVARAEPAPSAVEDAIDD